MSGRLLLIYYVSLAGLRIIVSVGCKDPNKCNAFGMAFLSVPVRFGGFSDSP